MPEAKVTYAVTADIHDKFDIIINASPVGMFPKVDACPVSDELIDGADYFFDVIYNPDQDAVPPQGSGSGQGGKGRCRYAGIAGSPCPRDLERRQLYRQADRIHYL